MYHCILLLPVMFCFSCKIRETDTTSLSNVTARLEKWPGDNFYNFDNLAQDLKKEGDIPSVEAFLKLLPNIMLKHFTMMNETETDQQSASFTEPRTILFHPEGGLYIAFSGQKAKSVELISVNSSGDSFDFFRLEFPLSFHQTKVYDNSSYVDDCKRCHEQDPRPNWGNYDFWRGAYGSNDDLYSWNEQFDSPDEIVRQKKELTKLKKFLSIRPQMKNYKLLDPPSGSPISPYRSESTEYDFHLRPNAHLTLLFANINAKRIARLIKSSPYFIWSKYLILFSGDQCQNTASPDNLKTFLEGENSDLFKKIRRLVSNELRGSSWWIAYMKLHGITSDDYQLEFSLVTDELYFEGTSYDRILIPAALTRTLLQFEPNLERFTRTVLRISDYYPLDKEDSLSKYDISLFEKLDRILPLQIMDFTKTGKDELKKMCESAASNLIGKFSRK